MRVLISLLTFLKLSSSSVYKSVKRDTDDKLIQEEIDDDDISDFLDQVENAQEVLEVPIEYEDDNKPSKTLDFILKYLFYKYFHHFTHIIVSVPIRDVWAVKDGKAELPCDINPPDPTDQVYLVLWYRDLAGKPLYSYDLRWVMSPPTHCVTDIWCLQGQTPSGGQALVSGAAIWVRAESEVPGPGGGELHGAGDQGRDAAGWGSVQVPGGLQELPHQEHEAQPHRSG